MRKSRYFTQTGWTDWITVKTDYNLPLRPDKHFYWNRRKKNKRIVVHTKKLTIKIYPYG